VVDSAGPICQTGLIPVQSTAIGKADGRMQVPANEGDFVAFGVTRGMRHVIFENAKSEQAKGVWEVVESTGELEKLPDDEFPHYDHNEAFYSKADSASQLILIRIKKLGAGQSILFGCWPHSESADGTRVPMLGAIVAKATTNKKDGQPNR
jgi:hypothetical protein